MMATPPTPPQIPALTYLSLMTRKVSPMTRNLSMMTQAFALMTWIAMGVTGVKCFPVFGTATGKAS